MIQLQQPSILRMDGMNMTVDFMIINAQDMFTKTLLALPSLLGSYYFFDDDSLLPLTCR